MTRVWEPAARGFRDGDEAGVKAAVDGFGELGYSGTDQKMTFATLPPRSRASPGECTRMESADYLEGCLSGFAAQRRQAHQGADSAAQWPTQYEASRADRYASLRSCCPGRNESSYPNATHEMWNEYPEECRNEVLAFIGKHYRRLQ